MQRAYIVAFCLVKANLERVCWFGSAILDREKNGNGAFGGRRAENPSESSRKRDDPKGFFDQFSCPNGVSMRKWLQQVKCGEVARVAERVEHVRHVCHSEWSSGACWGAFSSDDSAFWIRWGYAS